jgi:hypothetical protein
MIIFEFYPPSSPIIKAVGEGLNPPRDINEIGGMDPQFLVIQSRMPPRLMTTHEHIELFRAGKLHGITRKFYYAEP